MDIQKIKELALANGFSLKEQASGNMDLYSYVYEFAQAIKNEVLAQTRSVFGQDGVTTFDTEALDSEISSISSEFEAEYFFDYDDVDRLEMLVAKSMKLGELYERQKWQAAKAQAIPEGFVLVPREPTQNMMIAALAVISTGIGKDHIDVEIIQCWKKMIEAQEQGYD